MKEKEQPVCTLCGQPISKEERDYCLAQSGRFHGQVFCAEHQKRFSACPAMRWQPGGR
jgi:hypothetical protein